MQIRLELKGAEIFLSIDEARTLYDELAKLFGNKPAPFPFDPLPKQGPNDPPFRRTEIVMYGVQTPYDYDKWSR
jgi:hypothetical protein